MDSLVPQKLNRETLVDRLTTELRQQILTSRLQTGDALPSERELCDAFGVGRTTVRESLHRLHASGFVERKGNQLVVVDLLRLPPEEVDCAALAARLSVTDVFAVRQMLEAKAVELAAKNWQDGDLEQLRAALAAMRVPVGPDGYHVAHTEFHLAIMRIARNPVLAAVYESSAHLFFKLPSFWRVFGDTASAAPEPTRGQINGWQRHQQLYDAIEQRDTEESVRLSDEMLAHVERTLLTRMSAPS